MTQWQGKGKPGAKQKKAKKDPKVVSLLDKIQENREILETAVGDSDGAMRIRSALSTIVNLMNKVNEFSDADQN